MEYAKFTPLPKTDEEIRKEHADASTTFLGTTEGRTRLRPLVADPASLRSPTARRASEDSSTYATRQDYMQDLVDGKNIIKLKCDFGMDSYYYDTNYKTMYKVCNIDKSTIPKFEVSYDSHILEINNITEGSNTNFRSVSH